MILHCYCHVLYCTLYHKSSLAYYSDIILIFRKNGKDSIVIVILLLFPSHYFIILLPFYSSRRGVVFLFVFSVKKLRMYFFFLFDPFFLPSFPLSPDLFRYAIGGREIQEFIYTLPGRVFPLATANHSRIRQDKTRSTR